MRAHAHSAPPLPATPGGTAPPAESRSDWATLRRLFPYLWAYKWRVIAALSFMVGAKLANVGVPVLLKDLVDAMTLKPGDPAAIIVVPVALLFVPSVPIVLLSRA